MKRKHASLRILIIIIMGAVLLSGCDFSRVKIGEVRMMYGSNEDGHISYNYSTFTGIENGSVQVEEAQTISFDFDVTVSKGSLNIEWQDPNKEVVWRKNLVESDRGYDQITVETSGIYWIIIQGTNAGGEFDVSWKIQ